MSKILYSALVLILGLPISAQAEVNPVNKVSCQFVYRDDQDLPHSAASGYVNLKDQIFRVDTEDCVLNQFNTSESSVSVSLICGNVAKPIPIRIELDLTTGTVANRCVRHFGCSVASRNIDASYTAFYPAGYGRGIEKRAVKCEVWKRDEQKW